MQLTIVIPHRGNPLGLWATIHSCEEDLRATEILRNYVIVTNGQPLVEEEKQCLHFLQQSRLLRAHLHYDEPLTPPVARQRGAKEADGEVLAFFDNHCLVGSRYFERALADLSKYEMGILHSATIFYAGQPTHYHYKLKLAHNFWAESAFLPLYDYKPYQIAGAGHGGFLIKRSVFEEVGGYGPEELFRGYGGEELIFDLKMRRYGGSNWIDPKLLHYHYTGVRGYERHYSDDYYLNLMVSAKVIGGDEWMYKVYESFDTPGKHLRIRPVRTMFDLLQEASARSADYAREVDAKSKYTLNELLAKFQSEQIAM